ncbi:hypothetical protein EJ08DRAFT_693677 [Tothia fuscella]|uniref:SnoaL-like domain-containing protein n=1 Tax=Tothia fuscella TaxID=1048955 RepID=A0A9P4NYQ7_9PEZI|nr:hypothetical protein EJ08DRAFT_693677 [Tothia fuscella]
MRASAFLIGAFMALSSATFLPSLCKVDTVEAIRQAQSTLGVLFDRKQYERLGEVMTKDTIYDNSDLGLDYGGISRGLEQVKANARAAVGTTRVQHFTNHKLINVDKGCKSAQTETYIQYTRWDKDDLTDIKKTYRFHERCEDTWVLENGAWKLKYSLVTNMGPKPELPYFGK